jgi:cytochrome c6
MTMAGGQGLVKEGAWRSITLPASVVSLKEGLVWDTTRIYCSGCHSLDYITTQQKFTKAKWQAEVVNSLVPRSPRKTPELSRIISALTTAWEDNMKIGNKRTTYLLAGAFGLFALSAVGGMAQAASSKIGEAEFKEHCAACHADGGNIIKPNKTLSKKDREKNGVKTTKDIIRIMRKPGEGMTVFDEKTLPGKEAKKIAEYIIKTFK